MKHLASAWSRAADWTGRNLLFLMVGLAATQVIAGYRESLVLAVGGGCLFVVVAILALVARRPELLLGAYVAVAANLAMLQ